MFFHHATHFFHTHLGQQVPAMPSTRQKALCDLDGGRLLRQGSCVYICMGSFCSNLLCVDVLFQTYMLTYSGYQGFGFRGLLARWPGYSWGFGPRACPGCLGQQSKWAHAPGRVPTRVLEGGGETEAGPWAQACTLLPLPTPSPPSLLGNQQEQQPGVLLGSRGLGN